MKNAKQYEAKIKKKLLATLPNAPTISKLGPIDILATAILQANATDRQASKAFSTIMREFVDLNETRVSPIKEIVECLGKDYPKAKAVASMLADVLNNIYNQTCKLDIEYITEKPKREKRRALTELGLDTYSEALVSMQVFDLHAIPVDQLLLDCLEMDELIAPGSLINDVQGFLERSIPQKDTARAHLALRKYAASSAKALVKFQKARDDLAAKLQAEKDQIAQVKAQAKQDKTDKKAEKEAAKKAAEKAKKKAAKKKAAKKAPKKSEKKTVKKKVVKKKTLKKATVKASKKSTKIKK